MKRTVSCFFFLNLILLSVTVFADFNTATFDRDTHIINVSGNAGTDMAKQLISVALKCDENINDIKIVRADDNSEFECSFAVPDKTAVYECLYQTAKSEESIITSVNVYSSDVIEEALKAFASAKSAEEMEIVFSEYAQILGIREEFLEEISDHNAFYASVLNKSDDAEKVKDVVDLVNETAVTQIFNETSAAQMNELLEKYNALIGISSSELYKNYSYFENSIINEFEEKLGNYTFTSLDDIVDAFEICTILTEIQNASYYTQTQLMTETYYSKLSIDMSGYNKLSDNQKKYVMQALTGSNSANISEFGAKWKSAMDNALIKNTNSGNSSGGGSGSSRGSSGGSIVVEAGKDIPVKIVSFIDIEDVSWAKDAISALANKGVVNGKSEYRFYPNDDITRAEFVKILIGALGFEITSSEREFNDVAADSWAYPYVCTAVENEIVFGYSNTEFGAEDKITRQDMITMAMRALKKKKTITVNNEYELAFDDKVQIDDYALESIKEAVYLGIVNGMGNNCFEPKSYATRAQAALIIYQSINVNFNY